MEIVQISGGASTWTGDGTIGTFYMDWTWQTKRLVSVSGLLFAPGTEKTMSYLGPGSYLDLQNSNALIPFLEAP